MMKKVCYVLFEEVSDQYGTERCVCVSLDKHTIELESQKIVKHRTFTQEIPLLENAPVYDFEPLGCGCGG